MIALASEGSAAPEWVQLMPAGPRLKGRDGREWKMTDAGKVITRSKPPFAFDYEHGQDRLAKNGHEAPASGWAEGLEIRDGQIWARVQWTPRAATAVNAREYRFISPVFTYDPKTGEVQEIVGASLVNRPNFEMAALNSQEQNMLKDINAALGLAETATAVEVVMAINTLKNDKATALNSAATPSLEKYVPRADYDLALNRAQTAETALNTQNKVAYAAKVNSAIEAAVKAGKIAPASVDYHRATCSTQDGLAAFEKYVTGAPSLFTATGLDKKDPVDAGGATALNAEQRAAATAMGLPEKDFVAFLSERKSA